MYELLIAIIPGLISLIGTVLAIIVSNSKTIYRIEQLEKKVEKHNNVIERTYKLESEVELLKEITT